MFLAYDSKDNEEEVIRCAKQFAEQYENTENVVAKQAHWIISELLRMVEINE